MRPVEELAFIKQLGLLPAVEAIYLYGSRARGDETERSDIDLAIEAPTATQQTWNQIEKIIENADTLLKIDYVNLSKLKGERLKSNIYRDKKLIFKRGSR